LPNEILPEDTLLCEILPHETLPDDILEEEELMSRFWKKIVKIKELSKKVRTKVRK
jgi:hypothetical protein